MSISLKNHEDRITALENENTRNRLVWINLYSGHVSHIRPSRIHVPNQAIKLWISGSYSGADSDRTESGVSSGYERTLYLDVVKKDTIRPHHNDNGTGYTEFEFRYVGEFENTLEYRLVELSSTNDDYCSIKCLLKIYYIFRYNIQQILRLISPILKF